MCRGLIVDILQKTVNTFEHMKIVNSINEVVVKRSYKNLLGLIPTILFSLVKREEKTPSQLHTPKMVLALIRA